MPIPAPISATPPPPSNPNPFDTAFDGENTDDEWWEDDVTSPQNGDKVPDPLRITQWPKPPTTTTKAVSRLSAWKSEKRYSVHKPTRDKSTGRQKKQNAKAGIKLVTNLGIFHGSAPPQGQSTKPRAGRYVDLEALQALNGGLRQSVGSSKSTKNNHTAGAAISQNRSNPRNLKAASYKPSDDLSPDDRPIVIGLSIPSGDAAEHTLSPQTASSETSKIIRGYENRSATTLSPETPTIIITPAQSVSLWSMLDASNTTNPGSRAPSSVYSANPYFNGTYTDQNAPPLPQMPASLLEEERQRIAGLKSYFSPDSDDATMWDDEEGSTTRSRVVSTGTLFEEDESPILTKDGRSRSLSSASKVTRPQSTSTVRTQRLSTGWWNYITTPFLTRSNTFANREVENPPVPALPSLAIAAAKVHVGDRDGKSWEKQFSPLTPETSTTLSPDKWWSPDSKLGSSPQTPVIHDTRHKVQASTGTLPIIFSETAGFGDASVPSPEPGSQLSRENTTSTFHTATGFSPTDRNIPVVLDSPNPMSVQGASSTTSPVININVHSASTQIIQPIRAMVVESNAPHQSSPVAGATPPPPYSPPPNGARKYRAVFPPDHALGIQYPASPGPVSPGLQAAMSSQGAIPMSNVPLTPPLARRPINLNSGYPTIPAREEHNEFAPPPAQPLSKKAMKSEAKRRRHEKEENMARKAGGLWRGRGCIPNSGCYGRGDAEGRKRRRCYIGLVLGFVSMIVLAIVLATQLHRKTNTIEEPSQWLNLTGFPPIFAGLSTVAAPINIKANTGCAFPATQWSCDLPKELQASVAPNQSNQPNFLMRIQWDNSTETNQTFSNVTGDPKIARRSVHNAVTAGQFMRHLLLKARQAVTFIPQPEPPTFAEEFFLGNTTDGIVSKNKAGEPTPFYISFLSTETSKVTKRDLTDRQSKNESEFPDLGALIPRPSLKADGTGAPANLLPLVNQQPVRLYDRGLPTEHYGFYTYYDRSIYLKSVTSLNGSNIENGAIPDDLNGGAKEGEAKFRCTWTQTRFLVQIWTRMNTTARLLNSSKSNTQNSGSRPANFSSAPQDFTQPGSFPYPVTFTVDRHGGKPEKKMLYCYSIDDRRGLIPSSGKLHDEKRAFGGTIINRAPRLFGDDSDHNLGGFDGGTGGCGCKWRNFEDLIRV